MRLLLSLDDHPLLHLLLLLKILHLSLQDYSDQKIQLASVEIPIDAYSLSRVLHQKVRRLKKPADLQTGQPKVRSFSLFLQLGHLLRLKQTHQGMRHMPNQVDLADTQPF